MSKLDRRDFLLSAAPLSAVLALASVSETLAQGKPRVHLIPPNSESLLAVGEASVLRVLTKTAYPKFSRVEFKANGQLIGTATGFPYQITWTPTRAGSYVLEAEAFKGAARVASTTINADVLLYDGIGRSNSRLFNAELSSASFGMANTSEGFYGFPTNYVATLGAAQTIRRIDALLSATTGINNTPENITFPSNFWYIQARLWNNGLDGFFNSPRSGNLGNYELGVPNTGSTTTPFVVNSAGIKFYLTGWSNLNIPLPPGVPLALSIQFSHISPYDFTEFISFARSRLGGQPMWRGGGFYMNPPTFSNIGATLAVRIWAD